MYLGHVIAHLHVIEYQKRGLPHAHILIILKPEDRPVTADEIDKFVCAETPEPGTRLYDLVKRHMIHGPCGHHNPKFQQVPFREPCSNDRSMTAFNFILTQGSTSDHTWKLLGNTSWVLSGALEPSTTRALCSIMQSAQVVTTVLCITGQVQHGIAMFCLRHS